MSKYVICRAVDFFFVLGDILQGKVFVRLQMSCQSPIEFPYYSSTVGRVDVCAHCTLPSEKSQEMLKKYKVVLPVCAQCPYHIYSKTKSSEIMLTCIMYLLLALMFNTLIILYPVNELTSVMFYFFLNLTLTLNYG